MWLTEVASIQNPSRLEIDRFLVSTQEFLTFVLEQNEFSFLWEEEPDLEPLATDTFRMDIVPNIETLCGKIRNVETEVLTIHGLVGLPMHFKLRVVDSIGRQWNRVRGQLSVREWLKRIFDAIDAILDSIIAAAGGIGGPVKEFKDALSSLVKTV